MFLPTRQQLLVSLKATDLHVCKYLVRMSLGGDRQNDFEGGGVNPLNELGLPLKQVRMCCYCLNWVFECACAVCLDPVTASSYLSSFPCEQPPTNKTFCMLV